MKKFKEILKGGRITLRRLKPTFEMAKTVYALVEKNKDHLLPWMGWATETNAPEDTLKYLFEVEKEFKEQKKIDYGLYLGKVYLGNIGIFDINTTDKSAEIGYWIGKEFSGSGYMTEAVEIIENEFFLNQNLNRIQIRCDEDNLPSASIPKRLGYALEGTLREKEYSKLRKKMTNELIFSKLKKEWEKGK